MLEKRRLEDVSSADLEPLSCFLLKKQYDRLFNRHEPSPYPIWCLFWKEKEELVGFGAVSCHPELQSGYLHAFGAKHDPSPLLEALEQILFDLGATWVRTDFEEADPLTPAFSTFLQQHGFSPPSLTATEFTLDALTFYPPWKQTVDRPFSSPEIQEFAWTHLSQKEEAYVRDLLKLLVIPSFLSPFHSSDPIEPCNSLGLRKNDRIVGWMVNHRTGPQTITYAALYVDPRYTTPLDALTLLIHSVSKQQEALLSGAVFLLSAHTPHHAWRQFVHKRLKPHALAINQLFTASKRLSQN